MYLQETIVRDRRPETQNSLIYLCIYLFYFFIYIKLCLALHWLFDVKRFVTLWLLTLIPTRQIRATIASQTRTFNRPTQYQIISGRVLNQL